MAHKIIEGVKEQAISALFTALVSGIVVFVSALGFSSPKSEIEELKKRMGVQEAATASTAVVLARVEQKIDDIRGWVVHPRHARDQ